MKIQKDECNLLLKPFFSKQDDDDSYDEEDEIEVQPHRNLKKYAKIQELAPSVPKLEFDESKNRIMPSRILESLIDQ